jgi:hypothetical protein
MEFSFLVVVKEYLIDHETFFLKIALAIAEVQTPNFFAMSAIAILYSRLKIHEHGSTATARPGCGCRFVQIGLINE